MTKDLTAKAVSDNLMAQIPLAPSWSDTRELMALNHWLMLHYGYFDPERGFVEYD